jgi:hypothetical protein
MGRLATAVYSSEESEDNERGTTEKMCKAILLSTGFASVWLWLLLSLF